MSLHQKISVIIPCYNGEPYIERCLLSLLNQKFNDIEIIIVDDGSTDNSISIINKFKNQFPNIIKLIEQQHAGPGTGRNNGFKHSSGEFIWFIDIDDFVFNKSLEYLYTTAKKEQCDILCFERKIIYDNSMIAKSYEISEFKIIKDIDKTDAVIHSGPVVVTKFFNRSFLNKCGVIFKDMIGEDNTEVPRILLNASNIKITKTPCYVHTKGHSSRSTASGISTFAVDTINLLYNEFDKFICYDKQYENIWKTLKLKTIKFFITDTLNKLQNKIGNLENANKFLLLNIKELITFFCNS